MRQAKLCTSTRRNILRRCLKLSVHKPRSYDPTAIFLGLQSWWLGLAPPTVHALSGKTDVRSGSHYQCASKKGDDFTHVLDHMRGWDLTASMHALVEKQASVQLH
jgi:hypothetical protein